MFKEIRETIKNFRPSIMQLRMFGGVLAIVLGLFGWSSSQSALQIIFFALAALSAISALFFPRFLFPLTLALMAITAPIGWFISRGILIVFFSIILTPLSLTLRMLRRDILKERWNAQTSYWEDFEENTHPDMMSL